MSWGFRAAKGFIGHGIPWRATAHELDSSLSLGSQRCGRGKSRGALRPRRACHVHGQLAPCRLLPTQRVVSRRVQGASCAPAPGRPALCRRPSQGLQACRALPANMDLLCRAGHAGPHSMAMQRGSPGPHKPRAMLPIRVWSVAQRVSLCFGEVQCNGMGMRGQCVDLQSRRACRCVCFLCAICVCVSWHAETLTVSDATALTCRSRLCGSLNLMASCT